MAFKRLAIKRWQQFEEVELEFHPRLTILAGANGAGKTTLLRFLARHFGWSFSSLATPRVAKSGGLRYVFGTFFGLKPDGSDGRVVGSISYSTGRTSSIRLPEPADSIAYELTIDGPETTAGIFVSSHRPEFRYQRVEQLPLRVRPWRQDAYSSINDALRRSNSGGGGHPVSYHMKEILIGLAVFGFGSEVVEPDPEARRLYEQFQDVLRVVLPPSLGFERLTIRDRAEVVLQTRTGEFILDAVSGGVAAVIELAWQLFMYQPPEGSEFVVVIDEPENHLHPAMQRVLMPNFLRAFPKAQFIIATHSPFIVASDKISSVYALRYTPDRRVVSDRLEGANKSGTANDILREVLDVEVSSPAWVEDSFERILGKFAKENLTPATARRLRSELTEAGLERLVPGALVRLAEDQSK